MQKFFFILPLFFGTFVSAQAQSFIPNLNTSLAPVPANQFDQGTLKVKLKTLEMVKEKKDVVVGKERKAITSNADLLRDQEEKLKNSPAQYLKFEVKRNYQWNIEQKIT